MEDKNKNIDEEIEKAADNAVDRIMENNIDNE